MHTFKVDDKVRIKEAYMRGAVGTVVSRTPSGCYLSIGNITPYYVNSNNLELIEENTASVDDFFNDVQELVNKYKRNKM